MPDHIIPVCLGEYCLFCMKCLECKFISSRDNVYINFTKNLPESEKYNEFGPEPFKNFNEKISNYYYNKMNDFLKRHENCIASDEEKTTSILCFYD